MQHRTTTVELITRLCGSGREALAWLYTRVYEELQQEGHWVPRARRY